jgi:hypothetical protein
MSTMDISRYLSQPRKRYAGVRMQQGRVMLDSDWNESEHIDHEETRRTHIDVIGSKGTTNDGFLITTPHATDVTLPDGTLVQTYDFNIRKGSFFLGGLRFEVAADSGGERFLGQSDWLQLDASAQRLPPRPTAADLQSRPEGLRYDLVFLRGWEQCVTAVEDSELRERALGGPDTSVRLRRMRRVGVLPDVAGDCVQAFEALKNHLTAPQAPDTSGPPHTFDDQDYALRSKARLTITFTGEDITQDPCKPNIIQGYLGAENQTIRVALTATDRFIWGFDNTAPLYRVQVLEENGQLVTIKFLTLPRDQASQPLKGQAVEILPWEALLPNREKVAGLQGHLTTVQTRYDPETGTLQVTQPVPASWLAWQDDPEHKDVLSNRDPDGQQKYFYLRLWTGGSGDASAPDHKFIPGDAAELVGTGLEVTFKHFGLPGDYWIIAARPNTPDQVVPWDLMEEAPPAGTPYFFAPLALIRWSLNDDGEVKAHVQDCRKTFRPLCDISGCCTITVGDGTNSFGDVNSIQQAVDQLPPAGGQICILPGIYREHVVIDRRRNITLHGCGPQSLLQAEEGRGEAVIRMRNSQDITIRSLAIEAPDDIAIHLEQERRRADLARITLADLLLTARDRSAILGESGRDITVRDNRIRVNPFVRPLDNVTAIGREPAIFLAGDNLRIVGNQIISDDTQGVPRSPLGGLQIGGGSNRVEIRRNVITAGNGNGITLGSISFVPAKAANAFEALTQHFRTLRVSPSHGVSIHVDDNGCIQLDPNPQAPPGDDGESQVPISDGDLSDVRIVDNDISQMGGNGIAVVRFFDLETTRDFITVDRLTIEGNHIRQCMRLELGTFPPALRDNAAYGGIVLADGEYIVIRDNTIENNGSTFPDPICGIFILHGKGIAIEGNRVLHNGRPSDVETRPRPGQRGGIVLGLAQTRTIPVAPLGTQITGARQDGVPAARIHDNVVVSPEGRALNILAIGPVSVQGNQFTTHGSNSLNLIPLPNQSLAGTGAFSLNTAASVPLHDRLATTNPLIAFLDRLGGAVVAIINLGVSNEIYLQLLGLSGLGLADPNLDDGDRDDDLRLFVGGNILFNDNQVVLDALAPGVTLSLSSVLLLSLDDISMVSNQCDCDLAFDVIGTNALVLGWSVRVSDNRCKEGRFNSFLSALTGGGFNTTTDNQGTHCFFDIGILKPGITIKRVLAADLTLSLNVNTTFVSFLKEDPCKLYENIRDRIEESFGFEAKRTVISVAPNG